MISGDSEPKGESARPVRAQGFWANAFSGGIVDRFKTFLTRIWHRTVSDYGEASSNNRTDQLKLVLARSFGDRLSDQGDLAPLVKQLHNKHKASMAERLIETLASHGCPCDGELLTNWVTAIKTEVDLRQHERIINAAAPDQPRAWPALLALIEESLNTGRFHYLIKVIEGIRELNRSVAIPLIRELLKRIDSPESCDCWMHSVRFFPQLWGDDEFILTMADKVHDAEAAAAVGQFGAILEERGRAQFGIAELAGVIPALTGRLMIKRYQNVLSLIDEHGIAVDEFDPFVIAFSESGESIEWLDIAVVELGRLGRKVDRLYLTRLRDWAPDITTLRRYMRAVEAFNEAGLSPEQADELILEHLPNETATAALCQIGKIGGQLYNGRLTPDRARMLFKTLEDPLAVKRFQQAIKLLNDAKFGQEDVELLAIEFTGKQDDITWLEALATHLSLGNEKLDRPGLLRLKEFCPEVPHIYRYFKVRRRYEDRFPNAQDAIEELALETAASPEKMNAVVEALQDLIARGQSGATSAELAYLAQAL